MLASANEQVENREAVRLKEVGQLPDETHIDGKRPLNLLPSELP